MAKKHLVPCSKCGEMEERTYDFKVTVCFKCKREYMRKYLYKRAMSRKYTGFVETNNDSTVRT